MTSLTAFSQETDPLERNTDRVKYLDKTFRIDTTSNYYVDKVIRIIQYNDGSWEGLYCKYYQILDKRTGGLVRIIDVRQVMRRLGFSIVQGSDLTKIMPSESLNEEVLMFGAERTLVAVNMKSGQLLYHHKNSKDALLPFAADEEYFLTRGSLDFGTEDPVFQTLLGIVVFDKEFNEVLRVTHNDEKGRHVKSLGKGKFRINFKSGFLELTVHELLGLPKQELSKYSIEGKTVSIGNGAIKIFDEGWFEAQLMPSFTKKDFFAHPVTWKILDDSIPKGEYMIQEGSNFFPKYSTIKVEDNGIKSVIKREDEILPSLKSTARIRFNIETLTKDSKKMIVNKWDGSFRDNPISDGVFNIKWSDYLPVGETVKVENGKLVLTSPHLKFTEAEQKLIFQYPGFNSSHSGFLTSHGLKLSFSK